MSVVPLCLPRDETRSLGDAPDVDIVIPVYNEERKLAASIASLRAYLDTTFPFSSAIVIADNASTDRTWSIATELAASRDGISALRLDAKGRGHALRAAWSQSDAEVVAYMDVDLATGLDALLPLVAPLLSGHSDVAIGSRLRSGAHVVRGARRELISRSYNLLLRTALRSTCTDAQCGFKAMRREAALELLPLVEDNEWFFDTEILVTAQRLGLRIHEVPVDWVDDTDSRVDVVRTAAADLRGVCRLLGTRSPRRADPVATADPSRATAGSPTGDNSATRGGTRGSVRKRKRVATVSAMPVGVAALTSRTEEAAAGEPAGPVFAEELLRFAGVGTISTAAYVSLFAVLEPPLGSYVANATAIGLCSVANTAAHHHRMSPTARLVLDRRSRVATSAALMGVSLGFTTGALVAVRSLGGTSLLPELCAVTVANLGAAAIRFAILRTWVFRPEFGTRLPTGGNGQLPTLDHDVQKVPAP